MSGIRRIKAYGLPFVETIWLLAVLVVSILEIVSSTYNPFIYFNF